MQIYRIVLIPASFFVGVIFVILILMSLINEGLASAVEHIINFINEYKFLICLVLSAILAVFGVVLASGNNGSSSIDKIAPVLTAVALIPNSALLKEFAIWILELLSSATFTDSDVFSNAIMFIFMLPAILFALVLLVIVLGLILYLTTIVPSKIIHSLVEKRKNIGLSIYMIIHMVAMSVLAIGFY